MAATISAAPSAGVGTYQDIRSIVTSLMGQYFSATLGSEQGIVDYIMALMYKENRLRPDGPSGPLISDLSSSRAADYMNSPAVRRLDINSTPLQRRNIQDGKRAHGIMQLMGWNIVRGGSAKAQKCEFQQLRRKDLANQFLVDAGDDIKAKISGESNLERNILGGLLLLEAKWDMCHVVPGGWSAGGDTFDTRLKCAIGAYHGAAKPGTKLALASQAYVDSITGGDSYRAANGTSAGRTSNTTTAVAAASGPSTNGSGKQGEVPGC